MNHGKNIEHPRSSVDQTLSPLSVPASVAAHTAGPWHSGPMAGGAAIFGANGQAIAEMWIRAERNHAANAARIVACINALEGIADPQAFVAAAKAAGVAS